MRGGQKGQMPGKERDRQPDPGGREPWHANVAVIKYGWSDSARLAEHA
jgi:hypothetical protein